MTDALESLADLRIQGITITEEGLARLPPLPQVRSLWWNKTSQDSATLIRHLAVLSPQLTTLQLDDNDPESHVDLSTLGAFPPLNRIELYGPGMSDATMQSLRSLPQIQSVVLDKDTSVTETGIGHLAEMPGQEELICQTLTDGGLLKLTSFKALKVVNFNHHTKVTVAGLEAFKRARPDVKIAH